MKYKTRLQVPAAGPQNPGSQLLLYFISTLTRYWAVPSNGVTYMTGVANWTNFGIRI
jgi:hypothetical protein